MSLARAYPTHLEQAHIRRVLPSIENGITHEQEKRPWQRPSVKTFIIYEQPAPKLKNYEDFSVLVGAYTEAQESLVPVRRSFANLESTFIIENRQSVLRFVEHHHLSWLLLEAEEHLQSVFGGPAIKVLSLLKDDEGVETLVCYVKFAGSVASGRQALRNFDQQWWRARFALGGGKLNFDFDLI